MQCNPSRKLSLFFLLAVVCLQFFNCYGVILSHPNFLKYMHDTSKLDYKIPYLIDWPFVSIVGRIAGGYVFYKLAGFLGFFRVMRVMLVCHIALALFIYAVDLNAPITYSDTKFLLIMRFLYMLMVPASFMLPSLFLMNKNTRNPLLLSAKFSFAVGLGIFAMYKCLENTMFWGVICQSLAITSFLMLVFYVLFEKFCTYDKNIEVKNIQKKLKIYEIILLCSFGGFCGIAFSYHFVTENYINESVLIGSFEKSSCSYFYYAILFSTILVSKFMSKNNVFMFIKVAVIYISLLSISLSIIPHMSLNFFIIEQIIFGSLLSVLVATCHFVVYRICRELPNFYEGIFWFVSSFTIFSHTPKIILGLLGNAACIWLCPVYIISTALPFIYLFKKYEGKLFTDDAPQKQFCA